MVKDVNIDKLVEKYKKRYGEQSAFKGTQVFESEVTSTGILALDYALGTGGWLSGHCIEVYGQPNIGKTSIIGYRAIAEAQKAGKLCGIINVEPRYDAAWVEKNGVDTSKLIVMYPDTGEEAFEILRDWTMDPDAPFDFILFDSLGALVSAKSMKEDAKIKVGGESLLITDGVKKMVMSAFKNNVAVMFINQVRDDLDSMYGGLQSPGGWAVKHAAMFRIQLRTGDGKRRFTCKIDGEDIVVGRELMAVVIKSADGGSLGNKARFDFYHRESPDYMWGLDRVQDILNTGVLTKVIDMPSKGFYEHPALGAKKIHGKPGLAKALEEHPEAYDVIRKEVLEAMNAIKEG